MVLSSEVCPITKDLATMSSWNGKKIRFHHIVGPANPADCVSKHWDMPSVKPALTALLYPDGPDDLVGAITKIRQHAARIVAGKATAKSSTKTSGVLQAEC